MWFNKASIYNFTTDIELTDALLEKKRYTPCTKLQETSNGWTPPHGDYDAPLVYQANGYQLICLTIETKVLPASAVKERIEEDTKELETQLGRPLTKNDKEAIKTKVRDLMLPQAFSKKKTLYAYIKPASNLMVINSTSDTDTTLFIKTLRELINDLSAIMLSADSSPRDHMRTWLIEQDAPGDFEIGNNCKLVDTDESKGVITCKNQDLSSKEIIAHLEGKMFPSEIELIWNERIRFSLTDFLTFNKIKFLECITDEANDTNTDSKDDLFDANFCIMTGELTTLVYAVEKIFVDDQQDDAIKVK